MKGEGSLRNKWITTILIAGLLLSGCTKSPNDVEIKKTKDIIESGNIIPEKLPEYWPTTEWKTSLPEAQGMSSSTLADMFQFLEDDPANPIESLIIIRNGYIVAEKYYGFYNKDTIHPINSVTKSIMSSVTGVAIEEGFINSVDDRIIDYFPD